ncbi:MAG: hypothetical protein B7Z37_01200 [Verrucomicrobia bacterium 12-59-8]|nr:MAG: hypothetical protein B7Z37_01200 [Verrucomicrobia bacterium 12-59-8]
MKTLPQIALLACCCVLFLVGCGTNTNDISGPPFTYDDFGTELMASHLIGPRGRDTQVIARFGSTHATPPPGGPDVRYVSVGQAMFYLRHSVHKLPKTPENAALRQRLSGTYIRLYNVYSTKRNAFLSAPSASYGRGGMNRALMMPPMPPSI